MAPDALHLYKPSVFVDVNIFHFLCLLLPSSKIYSIKARAIVFHLLKATDNPTLCHSSRAQVSLEEIEFRSLRLISALQVVKGHGGEPGATPLLVSMGRRVKGSTS